MAKITILEQDLTKASNSGATENVVYVPGYANMGPANTPTLCSTLADFERIFGTVPYVFKKTQTYDGTQYAVAGDYEKSYVYAAELLKSGLPVLFERVAPATLSYASSVFDINLCRLETAKFTQNNVVLTLDDCERATDGGRNTYSFKNAALANSTYGPNLSTIEIDVITTDNSETKTTATFTYVDTSFTTNTPGVTDSVTLNGDTIVIHSTNAYNTITIVVKYTFADLDGQTTRAWFVAGDFNTISQKVEYKLYCNDTAVEGVDITINGLVVNCVTPTNQIINSTLDSIETSTKVGSLTLKAAYPGSYGRGINYSVKETIIDSNRYWRFLVDSSAITGKSEDILVSLTSDDKYYVDNIKAETVSFALGLNDGYTPDVLDSSLVKIAFNDGSLQYAEYVPTSDEFSVTDIYNAFKGIDTDSIFVKLEDKGEYTIKFITSGAYPTFFTASDSSIANIMLKTAANRADSIAIIDHKDTDPISLHENVNKITKDLSVLGEDTRKYGTMFTPWASYQMQTINKTLVMPASFAYLRCLAGSTKTNANWYAVSGVTRGLVPSFIEASQKVTGAIADKLQGRTGIAINPITNIKPYGQCIWGNRTLHNNVEDLTASSFLNIRVLSADVKKVIYNAAKKLTFELNNDILWLNFKSEIEPTLEAMLSGNGLSGYKIIKTPTTKKATISCVIKLFAIEAVEDWDITVELSDNYVSVQ